MAYEIDFNTSSADQKVDVLTKRIEAMSLAATKASSSLIPSAKAVQETRKVAQAHEEIAKAMDKVAKVSENATKKVQKDTDKTENGVKKFFNTLDKSITTSSHKINAWRGTYGDATQDMIRANEELKKEANALARASEMANAAKLAQAKQTNAQLVADEKKSQQTRTRDWTEYYKKQEAQVNRYTQFLKQSQSTWTNKAAADRQRLAAQMWKISQQETKFEQEAASTRTKIWSEYYKKQEAQIDRYNKALAQSRANVVKATEAQKKAAGAAGGMADANKLNTASMMQSNQVTAAFRASMAALGTSFGIYTSGTFAVAAGTYAVVSAMQSAVTVGADFEKSMYRVYAVTGQMGTTYEKEGNLYVQTSDRIKESQEALANAAVEASKVTIFTAVEAAEGLVALGMAGLNAQQSIGALTPSLQLAQIGMIDVYESADIMTNVMLGFGMSVDSTEASLKSATEVTDVLAAAITNSNSTIKEMSKSLSYVAPIAHAAGANIQETVAALETFHNVGIKGQRAGTSLRRAYVNLLEPTDKVASRLRELEVSLRDSEGGMRSLTDIMTDLKGVGADVADLVTIFGVRAAPAMVAFMNNLESIRAETKRLTEEVDGTGKAMADFMATSTSGQWQIIQSKIQAQFVEAFQKAEPAIKKLNYALFELIDKDLDGLFESMGSGIEAMATGAERLAKAFGFVAEHASKMGDYSNWLKAPTAATALANPLISYFTQDDEASQKGASRLPDAMMPRVKVPQMAASAQSGWSNLDYSGVMDDIKGINYEVNKGVLLTEEQVAEQVRREASSERLLTLAKLEHSILVSNTMTAESTSAKREMAAANEISKYKEKLGLITQEQALSQQLGAVDAARIRINEKFVTETAKIKQEMAKIRDINTGTQADAKKYSELLREQAKLNEQLISQTEQLNGEASKLTLSMQEAAMKEQGFGTLTKTTEDFATKLEVANQKLEGNKQATHENTISQIENAVARREVYQASSEFLILSDLQQQAFTKETNAIKGQLPALQALIDKNKTLTDAQKAAADEKKKQAEIDKIVKQFGKGKDLGPEGKGMADYTTALKRLQDYENNRLEIMKEYGYSELEFQNMILEAKAEADQNYWDSQHEHLASWRDEWSKAIADNIEGALFMEQSWSEAAQNIARTMLGTVVNTLIQTGAEMAANHMMKMMFGQQEMAMDAAITTSKVAGETAKQTANATTAATEAASSASSLTYFTQMLSMGPALAAAWAPAAMYINIASFGAAATAASATMLMAGATAMAAGVMSGVGGAAGEAISGSRQYGGPVKAGSSYLVGETGREVFTPDTNGYITSNQDMQNSVSKSGGDTYITYDNKYYIDATGNEDIEERLQFAIEEAAERGHRRVVQDFADNGDVAKLARQNR